MSHAHRPRQLPTTHDLLDDAERAFDALVREQYAPLCQFAYRLSGSRADAEEIVQDVLTSVWTQWTATRPVDPIAYLYSAVRRSASSRHRKAFVRAAHDANLAMTSPERTVADEFDDRAMLAALARAINRLPTRCRLVFTLSREQDLTYAEISRALSISIKTVETQMGRALKALRAALAPYRR